MATDRVFLLFLTLSENKDAHTFTLETAGSILRAMLADGRWRLAMPPQAKA